MCLSIPMQSWPGKAKAISLGRTWRAPRAGQHDAARAHPVALGPDFAGPGPDGRAGTTALIEEALSALAASWAATTSRALFPGSRGRMSETIRKPALAPPPVRLATAATATRLPFRSALRQVWQTRCTTCLSSIRRSPSRRSALSATGRPGWRRRHAWFLNLFCSPAAAAGATFRRPAALSRTALRHLAVHRRRRSGHRPLSILPADCPGHRHRRHGDGAPGGARCAALGIRPAGTAPGAGRYPRPGDPGRKSPPRLLPTPGRAPAGWALSCRLPWMDALQQNARLSTRRCADVSGDPRAHR